MRPIDAGSLRDNITDIYGGSDRLIYLADVLGLIDEQITYSKQETPDVVIWRARLHVAVTTSGSGDGHADPVGAPGTEGPSGAGPLNPLYKNDISNL